MNRLTDRKATAIAKHGRALELETKAADRVATLKAQLKAAEKRAGSATRRRGEARERMDKLTRVCADCRKSLADARRCFCICDPKTGNGIRDAYRCAGCQAKARRADPPSVYGPRWREYSKPADLTAYEATQWLNGAVGAIYPG